MKKRIMVLLMFAFLVLALSPAAFAATRGEIDRASREAYAEIVRRYGPATPVNPGSQLGRVFHSLTAQSHRRDINYQLSIIDHKTINAFALPNGQIIIFTGLLNVLPQDDLNPIAFILAHEIAHVEHRHVEKRSQQNALTDFAMRLLLGRSNGITKLAGSIVENLLVSGYSRGMETEADISALEMMTRAGYNPGGALAVFNLFENLQKQNSGLRIFPTHPRPADRRQNVENWMAQRGYHTAGTGYLRQVSY
jgi:beta-barrel assembly-enhancing protease